GMEQYRPAIDQYRRYLELVPTSAYAHQWMAICYVRLNEQDEALREAAAALAIDPRFSDSRVLRVGILASRGQYDAAVAEQGGARFDLARVLQQQGRREEAVLEYRRLLDAPSTAPAIKTAARQRLVSLTRR